MSTVPSISYLQLDAGYDPVFADNTSLTSTQAVAQAILTRLKLFFGEWWENLALGLPVFQSILGQLATPNGLAAMELLILQNVEGGPYVTSGSTVSASFTNGVFSYIISASTVFGTVTISNLPGTSAILE